MLSKWFFCRFIVPISIVICNDIMAYLFGFFFGRTPLIKVSHSAFRATLWRGSAESLSRLVMLQYVVNRVIGYWSRRQMNGVFQIMGYVERCYINVNREWTGAKLQQNQCSALTLKGSSFFFFFFHDWPTVKQFVPVPQARTKSLAAYSAPRLLVSV